MSQNIQVISAESLLLTSSPEVQFLVSIFQFLSQPSDKNYQVKSLTYLTQKFDDNLFEVVSQSKENLLLDYLSKKNINISFKQIANYDLYELAEYLLVTFGFDKKVDIYIQFFLDKIHEYATKNDQSVLNFIEWWEQKSSKFTVVIPEGVNAVQVMTIHKSKGLEFPVVIYPYADSKVKKSEDFFWTDKTEVDNLNAAIIPIHKDLKQTHFSAVYEKEMNKSRLDLINLMYVAFTRPKDRLYIIAKKGKERSEHGSVGDYLYDFCSTQPTFNTEQMTYTFGAFAKNSNTTKVVDDNNLFNKVTYNNWRNKIQISYQAPKVWEVENPETIGEYGTLIHNILSKIEAPNQVDEVLSSFVLKGIVTEKELPEIKAAIHQLFTIAEINNLFTDYDELKNERSILTSNGEKYQPDRVVVKNGITHLVDYKTGERELKHQEQIKNYRNLLTEMGYENVKAQLLYVKEGVLEEV